MVGSETDFLPLLKSMRTCLHFQVGQSRLDGLGLRSVTIQLAHAVFEIFVVVSDSLQLDLIGRFNTDVWRRLCVWTV